MNHFVKRSLPRTLGSTALLMLALVALVATWHMGASRSEPYRWARVTNDAGWSPSYWLAVEPFRGRLWLFGHPAGSWVSTDARSWEQVEVLGDAPRGDNRYVVFNEEVYAVGGVTDRSNLTGAAVWKSSDGSRWQLITDSPPWSARVMHAVTVVGDRLWLLGGYDGRYLSDVWTSADGKDWVVATAEAPWAGRAMHSAAVFAGEVWVTGGRRDMDSWWETTFNDVWHSRDGRVWTRSASRAAWSKRYGHASAAWDGRLWILAGTRLWRKNDVWHSTDGSRWTQLEGEVPWSGRFGLATGVFDDKLWVVGGKEGGARFLNDVWSLERSATSGPRAEAGEGKHR